MKRNELFILLFLVTLSIIAIITSNCMKSLEYTKENVVIKPGVTLWELGEQYKLPDDDIRRWVYEVRKINNLDNLITDMPPGKKIVILKRSE